MKKEIDKILLQLNGETFHSTEQVNEFFKDSMLRLVEARDEYWKNKIEEALPGKKRTGIGRPSEYWKKYGFDKNDFVTGWNGYDRKIKKNLNIK